MTVNEVDKKVPRPRLCHIVKWPDFDGYGFNLHAEKNKPGQYIGKVDPNSPADAAGLKEGDKIIEVNSVNISQENHKQVVQRIKSDPNQTRLLVVDSKTENYHKEKNIIITGSLPYIDQFSSEQGFEHIDTTLQKPEFGRDSPDSPDSDVNSSLQRGEVHVPVNREDSLLSERTLSNRSSVSSGKGPNSLSSGSPRSTPSPVSMKEGSAEMTARKDGGLDLPLTAKEMRERIVSKKKRDPRRDDRMDFRKKFEIIQTL